MLQSDDDDADETSHLLHDVTIDTLISVAEPDTVSMLEMDPVEEFIIYDHMRKHSAILAEYVEPCVALQPVTFEYLPVTTPESSLGDFPSPCSPQLGNPFLLSTVQPYETLQSSKSEYIPLVSPEGSLISLAISEPELAETELLVQPCEAVRSAPTEYLPVTTPESSVKSLHLDRLDSPKSPLDELVQSFEVVQSGKCEYLPVKTPEGSVRSLELDQPEMDEAQEAIEEERCRDVVRELPEVVILSPPASDTSRATSSSEHIPVKPAKKGKKRKSIGAHPNFLFSFLTFLASRFFIRFLFIFYELRGLRKTSYFLNKFFYE